jgi:hypothetical protein
MRPPFARTYSVDSILGPITDAFANRKRRVFLPAFVRIAYVMRALLHSKIAEHDHLRAAPEIRSAFVEQSAEQGSRAAALGSRWSE